MSSDAAGTCFTILLIHDFLHFPAVAAELKNKEFVLRLQYEDEFSGSVKSSFVSGRASSRIVFGVLNG